MQLGPDPDLKPAHLWAPYTCGGEVTGGSHTYIVEGTRIFAHMLLR
jgi:hypothetical protein